MKKQKRIWISLLLSFILIVVLSGCKGGVGPKTAKINVSFYPNPVPYSSETGDWSFDVILSEINGIGVSLTSLKFDSYNQQGQLYSTQILDEEEIIDWFDSSYIPAFSTLQASNIYHTSTVLKYDILTVEGVDNNYYPIKATGRVNYLPKSKYWGKLYNACDGICSYTGEALDFYIDGAFIATISSGENLSIELAAGEHIFKVLLTKTQEVLEPGDKYEISEGWWYWWGCYNGTHP